MFALSCTSGNLLLRVTDSRGKCPRRWLLGMISWAVEASVSPARQSWKALASVARYGWRWNEKSCKRWNRKREYPLLAKLMRAKQETAEAFRKNTCESRYRESGQDFEEKKLQAENAANICGLNSEGERAIIGDSHSSVWALICLSAGALIHGRLWSSYMFLQSLDSRSSRGDRWVCLSFIKWGVEFWAN